MSFLPARTTPAIGTGIHHVDFPCFRDLPWPLSLTIMLPTSGLAEWAPKELDMAEVEMPGLMSTREEYAKAQP